ncbi:MAG: flagellar motor protein MotB [Pseudomonadota bacterium]
MASPDQPIIIKKIKKGGHGHHGGAWKVAYADFVTAMMAFFLLMWLINTTSPEQKRGIADYFAPASVSKTTSGAGGLLGGLSFSDDGARANGSQSPSMEASKPKTPKKQRDTESNADDNGEQAGADEANELIKKAILEAENSAFEAAEQSIRQALQDLPELTELSKHILIEVTPEGMRIQLVDQEGRPMFAPGAAEPLDRVKVLLRVVADSIDRLPNRITVSGHTDAAPMFRKSGYSNWNLSAERANEARKVLAAAGLDPDRFFAVTGKAGSEPLFPDDPFMAANRRISILLLREAPVLPPNHRL